MLTVAVAPLEDADENECPAPEAAVDEEWNVSVAFPEELDEIDEGFSSEAAVDENLDVCVRVARLEDAGEDECSSSEVAVYEK